jgi:hypothetical protein
VSESHPQYHPRAAAYPARLKAALIAAALLGVWGAIENLQSFQIDTEMNVGDPYMVNLQPARLAGVMEVIPRTVVVGYLSDSQNSSAAALAMFNSARYTLAPRLLVEGTDRDWVLGNFTKPADYAALARERGLRVVQDFGNGVVLFGRAK